MTGRRAHGEGTIFRRKRDQAWVAQLDLGFENGKRVRRSFSARTQREAREKLQAARAALREGKPVKDQPQRLDAFLREWVEHTSRDLAVKTQVSYHGVIERHIVPDLGRIPLDKLRASDINALLTRKRRCLSVRSCQLIHAVLRAALKQAHREGLIQRNPIEHIKAPRPPRDPKRVHALDFEVLRQLLDAAKGERLSAMLTILAFMGLRKGEVLALRWSRIDFNRQLLVVDSAAERQRGRGMVMKQTKTEASRRTLVMPHVCVQSLTDHRRRQIEERIAVGSAWSDPDLVFTTETGRLLDEKVPNLVLRRACEAIGIPPERVHNLRHTAATLAAEATLGDMFAVQKLLGLPVRGLRCQVHLLVGTVVDPVVPLTEPEGAHHRDTSRDHSPSARARAGVGRRARQRR